MAYIYIYICVYALLGIAPRRGALIDEAWWEPCGLWPCAAPRAAHRSPMVWLSQGAVHLLVVVALSSATSDQVSALQLVAQPFTAPRLQLKGVVFVPFLVFFIKFT